MYDLETFGFLAVNDAAVARYGYTRDEFLALTVLDIRPPEDIPDLLADIRDSVARRLEYRGVWRHRWKDGTVRRVEVSAHAFRFGDRPARLVLALDATDRLRAEADAGRGLARLRAVVESMADGLVVADADGDLLEWNPAALRMHGYASLDEARQSLAAFAEVFAVSRPGEGPLPFHDWPMPRVLRGETVADELLHLRRTDTGRELVVLCSGAPVRGPGGAVEVGVVTMHDMTHRKRAEREARRTTELLQAVADGTTDAVFVKDRGGRYLLCNPATAGFIGRPAGEVLGRTDAELFDAESARRIMERDRRVMESGAAETAEEVLTAAGVTRAYLATKAPYRDGAGAVVGVVGISRDVTAQRNLQAERDALLARLQLQFEWMPLACIQFDAGARITDWNPAAERTFGFSKAEALGMAPPFERFVPAACRPLVEDIFARVRAGDRSANAVNENYTRDGRVITCEWFNTPLLDADGRYTGMLCLAQDLTGRLVLEGQLRQAQKMEAVGQLAGGVAHDFNNMLTVINGYSDLLLASAPAGDPSRELLEEIRRAGERSAGLTHQLLAYSRKQVLAPKILDLNAVVRDTERMLRRVIGEDLRLAVDLDPRLGRVKADRGQLEQVLLNLAVNARDAMPTGGRLTISTRDAAADGPLGPGVVLSVADTGGGMTEEVRAKIFEPFFTTKGVGEGTGLGLAVVHGVIAQSGGSVEVESAVGRGTTFRIRLPRVEEEEAGEPHGAGAARAGTETVLLVEDEDAVRELTRHVLRNNGYAVLEAAEAVTAARVAADHGGRIDLLVTDVVMPGGGGPDLAGRLAAARPGLKVLYLSGYTDDAVLRHGVAADRVHFLQKPFTPAGLARKVRDVLDTPV